jgi:hypothetical protein
MITKEQALAASEFHIAHSGLTCTRWRRNGKTKTWVRNPAAFRVSVKHGLNGYGQITEVDAGDYHVAGDCPHGDKP